jgi:hypothetical protein
MFAMTDEIAERARKIGGGTLRSVSDITRHQRLTDNDEREERLDERSLGRHPEHLVDHAILCEDIPPHNSLDLAFAQHMDDFIALDPGKHRGVVDGHAAFPWRVSGTLGGDIVWPLVSDHQPFLQQNQSRTVTLAIPLFFHPEQCIEGLSEQVHLYERTWCAPGQGTPRRTARYLRVPTAQQRPDLQADGVPREATHAGSDRQAGMATARARGKRLRRPATPAQLVSPLDALAGTTNLRMRPVQDAFKGSCAVVGRLVKRLREPSHAASL